MSEPIRVLISYSHDSDAHRERIRDLAGRLRGHGIDAWIDQYSPAPPEGWPRWTEREFARARFIIVACTEPYAERLNREPGVGSGVGWEAVLIRQELYRQGGNTRLIPIYFDGDDRAVPPILQPYTRHDLPTGYEQLLRHILGQLGTPPPPLGPQPIYEGTGPDRSRGQAAVKPWNVPPWPAQYLPRQEMDALKASLIASETQTVAVTGQHHRLGIQGMPGVGKTVLAAALATDPDIHEAFPGGVFWLTLGREPDDVAVWQGKLAAALAGRPVDIRTVREGKTTLGELFATRPPSLLIIDDVWKADAAYPFDAPSPPSRLLITTRNREVAEALGATVRELRELKSADALTMLAAYAGRPADTLPETAPDIVKECGELPLAVAMAGAMLRGRPEEQWPTLLEQLRKADLGYLEVALPQYRQHRSMLAAIEVSVQELPEEAQLRYLDFAVFAEDAAVPERVLQRLWAADGIELAAAHRTVNRLMDRSLIQRDEKGRLTIHGLQHDYVRARIGKHELASRHTRLVDAYRSASPGKALHAVGGDGYFYEYIARHVRDGEGATALRDVLLDHRWLSAKLKATEPNALLADYELLDLAADEPLRLLRDALRLSAHVLSQHPEELSAQVLGRLRAAPESELRRLCADLDAHGPTPSLLPLWPSLMPPGGPLRRTLEGHGGWVNAVALSEDGRTAISGSGDKTVEVWDVEMGEKRGTLRGHTHAVSAVALSEDGKTALSGSWDKTVKVWDVETGKERRTLEGHTDMVTAVALSRDGMTAVSGSRDKTVKVWDLETGEERRTLEGHTDMVTAVALSRDGMTAVSGSHDKRVKAWDVEMGEERQTFEGHSDVVEAVALSADGKTAISGSRDKRVKLWDVETGKPCRTLQGHVGEVYAVALSADGKTAISGGDRTIKAWDVATGEERLTLKGHADTVTAVALSRDGKMAVSGSHDKTVKAWDVERGKERLTFKGHAYSVLAVALSADGKMAVSGSDDGTLKVWDEETGEERLTLKGDNFWVKAVALSEDGAMAVSGGHDGTLKVWDVKTGKERLTLKGRDRRVSAVALSKDGKTAVSGSEFGGVVKVWDVETGEERRPLATLLRGHFIAVHAVALSEDGRTAISGSSDESMVLQGESVVSGGERVWKPVVVGTVRVWDVEAGKERRAFEGHASGVSAVALSANGKMAVSGSWDRTVKVWDVETGEERRTLEGHAGGVSGVALSEDGKTVVSVSEDKTVKVWDVETGTCLASFTGEARFNAVALSRSMRVFAGDSGGHIHSLVLRLPLRKGPT